MKHLNTITLLLTGMFTLVACGESQFSEFENKRASEDAQVEPEVTETSEEVEGELALSFSVKPECVTKSSAPFFNRRQAEVASTDGGTIVLMARNVKPGAHIDVRLPTWNRGIIISRLIPERVDYVQDADGCNQNLYINLSPILTSILKESGLKFWIVNKDRNPSVTKPWTRTPAYLYNPHP